MADEADNAPEIDENDVLELTDEVEPGDDDQQHEDEDEETVGFDDDEADPQPDDSGLVKHLREQIKLARQEAAEARKSAPKPQPVEVGAKPTLWDEGIDGDEDKYDAAMEEYRERKAAAERQATEQTQSSEEQQRAFSEKLEKVVAVKRSLGKNADSAFDNVKAALGEERAAALVHIAESPEAAAKLMYALGSNADRLTALAAETDPLRFVKAVAKLEGQVKTMKRRKVIEPDVAERGSAPVAASERGAKQIAKLKAKAEETGDYTAYLAAKRAAKA